MDDRGEVRPGGQVATGQQLVHNSHGMSLVEGFQPRRWIVCNNRQSLWGLGQITRRGSL